MSDTTCETCGADIAFDDVRDCDDCTQSACVHCTALYGQPSDLIRLHPVCAERARVIARRREVDA